MFSSLQNTVNSVTTKISTKVLRFVQNSFHLTLFRAVGCLTVMSINIFIIIMMASVGLKADDKIRLASTSPGGAVVIESAIREGYFAEEGLEVETVSLSPDDFFKKIVSGEILGGEINYLGLGEAARGMPLVFTAGLYSGMVEILGVPEDVDEKRAQKSRKIVLAVADLGSGPAVAAARYYRAKGIDPDTEVTWLKTPDPLRSLENGEATALVRWELKRNKHGHKEGQAVDQGSGQEHGQGDHGQGQHELNQHGSAHQEIERSVPEPFKEGHKGNGHSGHDHQSRGSDVRLEVLYSASASLPADDPNDSNPNPHAKHTAANHLTESFVVLNDNLVKEKPWIAAAVSRALIRGARWTGENQSLAAALAMEKGLWTGKKDSLEAEIARYMWMPNVSHAKEHLRYYIHEGLRRGVLPDNLDEDVFFKQIFSQVLPDLN